MGFFVPMGSICCFEAGSDSDLLSGALAESLAGGVVLIRANTGPDEMASVLLGTA